MGNVKLISAFVAGVFASAGAFAGTVVSGFDANTLAPNDDGSTGLVDIGFTASFFGNEYTQLYVNNNGNVTFDFSQGTYTPYDLNTTGRVIIAPFFADVDTRSAGSPVTYVLSCNRLFPSMRETGGLYAKAEWGRREL